METEGREGELCSCKFSLKIPCYSLTKCNSVQASEISKSPKLHNLVIVQVSVVQVYELIA